MSSLLRGAVRLAAFGPLPVDQVWERYTQPRWWSRWAPHLRHIDYPEPVIRAGTSGRVKGVGGLVATFHIEAVDEDARTWSWSVQTGAIRVFFEHGVDVAYRGSERGSRAWLVTHAVWPVALGYAPIARYSLGRLVTRA